jgi:NADH dehydrogenase FAD-containing subunit
VLVGAGHAHLYTLSRAAAFREAGASLTLVAPGPFWYSGLATGVLSGRYPPALDQIDVRVLVRRAGGEFLADQVTGIDAAGRLLRLRSHPPLSYDVLSLNVGSEVPLADVPGADRHGFAVKPIENLWKLHEDLQARFSTRLCPPPRVVVLGGGATGCEVAANVEGLARRECAGVEVTLVTRGPRLLEGFPDGAGRTMLRVLQRRGVRVLTGATAARVEEHAVFLADGQALPCDIAVHAWGLAPPALLHESGLPTESGGLRVDEHLRCVGDERIFGGGDCIAFPGPPLPRVGVHAVREAPILFHNLLATVRGTALRRYDPQKRCLLILNLGDGTGLATWGGWHYRGWLAYRLKDWLDRSFLRKYRAGGRVRSWRR